MQNAFRILCRKERLEFTDTATCVTDRYACSTGRHVRIHRFAVCRCKVFINQAFCIPFVEGSKEVFEAFFSRTEFDCAVIINKEVTCDTESTERKHHCPNSLKGLGTETTEKAAVAPFFSLKAFNVVYHSSMV